MSDQWGPDGSDDAEGAASPPPPPPPPPPGQAPVEPALTLESESEVTRSGGIGGRAIAGVIGALLLVGGTVFAVSQLGSSGPGSPEAAVSELLDAASNEDVLGLLAALDPGERDALQEPVENLFDQLERLEVLDNSFALDGVAGIDLAFEDVTFRTEPVRDDLVRVYFAGGTVTTSVNSDEVPIGDFVSDTLDRFGVDISGFQQSETNDVADAADTFIVARNGSDGWRVSIGYTAAEAARLSSGEALPADGIEPIGSGSPEAAVEGMLRAAADLDMAGVVAHLSPGELGALQDYAGLYMNDIAPMADAGGAADISIDELDLTSEGSGDRASVFVQGFTVTVTFDGETITVSYADDCFTLEGDLDQLMLEGTPFGDGPICIDEFEELVSDFYGTGRLGGMEDELGFDFPTLPAVQTSDIGITTAKVDGDWYVAPISTGLDAMVAGLEVLERTHLDAMVDFVEEMMTSFQQSFTFEEDFDSIGDPLTGEFYDPGVEQPTPTTAPAGTYTETDEAALAEFVAATADDEAHGECLMSELDFVDPFVRYELADSYAYDYVPSPDTQQVYVDLIEYCRGP